jgi:AcrR family transcriptional regulator
MVVLSKAVKAKRKAEPAPPQTRKERALETRRRMLEAAYDLFCERGYAATTMDAIAETAGVAVQTLYFTFHTKGAILSETVGAAVLGFDRWDPKAELVIEDRQQPLSPFHPWFGAFEKEKDPLRALGMFVDVLLVILARMAPLAAVTASAAASDPEVKAAGELGERRRADAYRVVIDALAKKGKLRTGTTARRATDILLTVLSAETYQQLTAGRGWSPAECRRWMLDVLAQQLLPRAR